MEERTEKLPGNLIESTWPATIGQAKLAQEKGDEIHTLGIQIDDDKKGTIKHNLSLIASPGFYQYAADADAIETYLKNQAKDVVNSLNTVVDGHINDPLGSQFDYADKTVVVSSVGDNAVTDKPTATINGGVLSVNGLNVGKNQEVEITYQVYLKTEDPDFKPDYWYQMNGKTTFQPRGDDPNTVVEFGVPSAKAPAVDVPVQKIWHTLKDADTPNTLPDELSVTIKRIKHTDLKDIVDKDWAERLSLKKGDNWKGTISAPAYDNSGNAFTYFVSDEGKSGYTDPDSYILSSTGTGTEKDPVIATNQQYGFQFVKKDSKTDQDIKDPSMEFSLTSYSDSSFQGVSPVAALHQTKPHALAPGYYGIKEKTAPKGYVLDDTEYYFQLTSDGKWNYFGTNDPNSTGTSIADSQLLKAVGNGQDAFEVTGVHQNILQLTKYDKPKPTVPLTVVKTDNQGTPLAGAKFTLTGTNQASQSLTSDGNKDGQQFTQQLQANGSYTLSETQAPLGYQKSNNRVAIKIDAEGKVESVTVNGNELQSGKTLSGYTRAANDDGTSLTLTVENQPLPILPHTGGQGMVRAAAFALMMLVVAAVLAVVIWIKRRGVRIHD